MFEINQQLWFSNLLLPYKLHIFWLECEKYEKPQIHFKNPSIQKLKKCNISYLFTTYLKSIK
jgi:hypothetical protein